nr:SRPBCC family protein [Flexivirga aerilata]
MSARPTVRRISAPPDAVWEVLSDGWSYASWVVGSARIRALNATWPEPGSRLHHSVGLWPVLLHDHTDVVSYEPNRQLVLAPRAWPWGRSQVRIDVLHDGSQSLVRMTEDVVSGPGTLVPSALRQLLLRRRNRECLRRLAFLAERRTP